LPGKGSVQLSSGAQVPRRHLFVGHHNSRSSWEAGQLPFNTADHRHPVRPDGADLSMALAMRATPSHRHAECPAWAQD